MWFPLPVRTPSQSSVSCHRGTHSHGQRSSIRSRLAASPCSFTLGSCTSGPGIGTLPVRALPSTGTSSACASWRAYRKHSPGALLACHSHTTPCALHRTDEAQRLPKRALDELLHMPPVRLNALQHQGRRAAATLTYRGEDPFIAGRPPGERDAIDVIVDRITSRALTEDTAKE